MGVFGFPALLIFVLCCVYASYDTILTDLQKQLICLFTNKNVKIEKSCKFSKRFWWFDGKDKSSHEETSLFRALNNFTSGFTSG